MLLCLTCDTVEHMNDFERLLDAVSFAVRDRDPSSIHRKTLAAARKLTGARYGAFSIMETAENGQESHEVSDIVVDGEGDMAQFQLISHLPAGRGILGDLLRSHQVLRLADLTSHPHFSGFPEHHPSMTSFLGIEVRVGERTFGELYLADKAGGKEFTKRDEDLIIALAGLAAVRLENVELSERTRTLAVMNERQRIARDLHDSVIQRLFAVGLTLQSSLGSSDDSSLHANVQHAVDDLEETIDEIRSVIFALQGETDSTRHLRLAILSLVSDTSERLGFEPRVRLIGPVESGLSDELGAEILLVVRELLSNVVRHAQATHASLTVSVSTTVTVEMLDDGLGMTAGCSKGMGLRNLEERAAAHGGRMTIHPRRTGGTGIIWRIPRDASHDVL